MAHLLLPSDLSANAFNAARYAIHLYGAEGNTFTVLNSYMVAQDPMSAPWTADDLMAGVSREGLDRFVADLREEFHTQRLDLRTSIGAGDVAGAVIGQAEEGDTPVDLVVMGTQGASGLQEVLMGTHTADVIKRSGLPVLAVPEQASYRVPRRIVLADDGAPLEHTSLKILLDIARWSKAEVMIVRVVDPERDAESESSDSPYDALLGAIPRSHHFVSGDNVTNALHDMADQSDADLVVVLHRHRGLFEQLFHRSTAARLAMHTHIPMLVLQQGAR